MGAAGRQRESSFQGEARARAPAPTARRQGCTDGLPDCYKIKIATPQFRLAYHVDDVGRLVTLLAVSSRDDVYALLEARVRV